MYLYACIYVSICLYVSIGMFVCACICMLLLCVEAITLLFPSLSCHKNPKQNRKPNKILLFPLHSYIT